jgi:hypothetical protein
MAMMPGCLAAKTFNLPQGEVPAAISSLAA